MAERKKAEKKDLEKRARIEALLKDPEWVAYIDGIIAGKAGCNRALVIEVRKELEQRGEIEPQPMRKYIGADGVVRVQKVPTGSRGKKPAKSAPTRAKSDWPADGTDETAAALLEECRGLARTLTAKLAQVATLLGDQDEGRGTGKAA